MPMSAIQRCFVEWHDTNARRFLVPVRRGEETPRSLRLDFPGLGLEEHLHAALGDGEITVFADVEGECWDLLVSLDLVVPERVEGGWVCRHCVGGGPYTGIAPKLYGSHEDLWRDHLFEEFLAWVNTKLAQQAVLGAAAGRSGPDRRSGRGRQMERPELPLSAFGIAGQSQGARTHTGRAR